MPATLVRSAEHHLHFKTPALQDAKSPIDSQSSAFLTRAWNGILSLQEDLSKLDLNEAASAPSDYLVLVRALSLAPVASQLAEEDPLMAARLRGLERKKQLVQDAGGVATSAEVASILGISRHAVDKRRLQHQLLALTQGRRGYAYPRFQFLDGATLQGFEEVMKVLQDFDPWMQMLFFAGPNDRLRGKTPLKILQDGDIKSVLRAAGSYGEQGAA